MTAPIRYFESEIAAQDGKYPALRSFRANVVKLYEKWYDGEMDLFGQPVPGEGEKIVLGSRRESAILTWSRLRREKYLKKFRLDRGAFIGKRILDIGPGGIPYGLIFEKAEVICLDPLLPFLKGLGYPFRYYDPRAVFICGRAEDIPLRDRSVDAIISMNVDHFDDFAETANEIRRVATPDCQIRLLISYHNPSPLEPIMLNDELVIRHFEWCQGFKKIRETLIVNSEISAQGEMLTLWTNFSSDVEVKSDMPRDG